MTNLPIGVEVREGKSKLEMLLEDTKNGLVFLPDEAKLDIETEQERKNAIMRAINHMTYFYRENPHRFAYDYLNIRLKPFQCIILYEMFHNNFSMYVASRGQGKSFLLSVFIVIMCILYPNVKIVVVSKTKQQALEIMGKIENELSNSNGWGSDNLRYEIDKIVNGDKPHITFKGGSTVHFAVANDNARHFRANVVIVDEFVKTPLTIIDTVIRKFLTAQRQAGFLEDTNHPEYQAYKDPNKEIYASSAWLKSHWSYEKMKSYLKNMLKGNPFFVCNLPYQLAVKEGLLDKTQVEMEMTESTFDSLSFSIEMEAKWLGNNKDSFFNYEDLKRRCLIKRYFPTYEVMKIDPKQKQLIPKLAPNERRILSVDVALMASKKTKNDASCIILNSAIPSSSNVYHANFVLCETYEGLTTDELGLMIMRYYYLYECTDIVIDGRNFGISVIDFMMKEQYDSEFDRQYNAFTVVNNEVIAERCNVSDAIPCIWVVQGSSTLNTRINILLRSGFKNNNINLLLNHYDGEDYLKETIKNYETLSEQEKLSYLMPYIETDLLINELINLEVEVKGSEIKLFEKSGMRKDRYSSLGYNYYILKAELEPLLKPEWEYDETEFSFKFRKPKIY